MRDNEKATCMLTDVAISGDRNVTKKIAEEILKCKDLITEIQRIGNVKKTKVIPVIIEATGANLKSLRQYLSNLPGQLDTTAILDTAHILRNVLM
jgi:hypothetical protein